MMQGTKKLLALGVAVLALALPGQALAESPTNDSYDDSSVAVVNTGGPGEPAEPASPGTTSSSSGSSLPFSGLDVALLAAMGGGLVLLGVGMRRLTRRPDTA